MNIDLQKIVGKNYNKFWHSKKRYIVCKGSRGSKKSTTTALKYIYLIMYYFHTYKLKPNLLVIRRYMNTSLVRYMQVKDIIYRDYTRLNMKLIDEYELNLYFMCNNIRLPSSKIEEIPIDKLQLVIDKMSIIIKELDDSKTVMFDMDDINEFVLECSKMVIRDLKCYGIEVK